LEAGPGRQKDQGLMALAGLFRDPLPRQAVLSLP